MLFSEPKIPQFPTGGRLRRRGTSFSALQRAENSSIAVSHSGAQRKRGFQCSSASRKFLNLVDARRCAITQRVSVLFSEPKIPQWDAGRLLRLRPVHVSVLFSEPKIPQFYAGKRLRFARGFVFQCSSASRKFLNLTQPPSNTSPHEFQCSSASRKFLNSDPSLARLLTSTVSVLFSEPKIPQFRR